MFVRLGRALANSLWLYLYPHAILTNFSIFESDRSSTFLIHLCLLIGRFFLVQI